MVHGRGAWGWGDKGDRGEGRKALWDDGEGGGEGQGGCLGRLWISIFSLVCAHDGQKFYTWKPMQSESVMGTHLWLDQCMFKLFFRAHSIQKTETW